MTTIFPSPAKNNPGVCTVFNLNQEENGVKSSQEIDLTTLLGEVLTEENIAYTVDYGWLTLAGGLSVLPQLAAIDLEDVIRTTTTIELSASNGAFAGLFEFQHSNSEESVQDSLREGFRQWLKVDALVLLDALREEPEDCTYLQMEFPPEADQPALTRRIVLGPVAHLAIQPSPTTPNGEAEEHPF